MQPVYTWGVDGYGRAHICIQGKWEAVLCMLPGVPGCVGVWLLTGEIE